MPIETTLEKRQLLQVLVAWFREQQKPFMTLGGYAGTGKTTLLSQFRLIINKLQPKLTVAFCAYTGKASRVLETTLRFQEARMNHDFVGTVHSLIYAPMINTNNQIMGWTKKKKLKADIIIVDEASMVDRQIWNDLLSFHLPVLAVGDHGQLPPIGQGFNLMQKPDLTLETIHRQAADNPIIQLSILAREQGCIPLGKYGPGVRKLSRYESETGGEVEEMMLSGKNDLLILTGLNSTRIKLNQAMRMYKGFNSPRPQLGDQVICLKNNWELGIYNGMVGRIIRIQASGDRQQGMGLYEAEIEMEHGELVYMGNILADQFDNPLSLAADLTGKDRPGIFDFGYALTVHKAQGSQAKRVLLFEERNKHMTDDDWRRWLYTGITRAEEALTLVGA